MASLVLVGCGWDDPNTLTVATAGSTAKRAEAESLFRKTAGPDVRIHWLLLSPSDDPRRIVHRRLCPDVILGGPAIAFERLDQADALESLDATGPSWLVVRRQDSNPDQDTSIGLDDPQPQSVRARLRESDAFSRLDAELRFAR